MQKEVCLMSDTEVLIREAAKRLLDEGVVEYVIGWENTRFPEKTKPAFIKRSEDTSKLVWNSFCINGLAKYTLDNKYPEKKIGIIARGCDSRALVRLINDKQIDRENIYIIGLPCDGKANKVCETCSHKNPVIYDELIGNPVKEEMSPDRFKEVEEFEKLSPDEKYEFWVSQYDKCIRCYACRNVCPACNCRECYADQAKEGWQGKQYNRSQNQIYGLTRVYHVGDRCIECGECERACPMGLPIMRQTRKMLKDINDLFGDYECGLEKERTPILGEYGLNDADDFM